MAKKNGFGKLLAFCVVAGAAAAGAYYYLTKRDQALEDDFDDDFDNFDDFETESEAPSRKYVDLETSHDENADGSSVRSEDQEGQEDQLEKSEEFFNDENRTQD